MPIKKYGTHSALNMFDEFSMINPGPLAPYVGFTEVEVEYLCHKYRMDKEEVKAWWRRIFILWYKAIQLIVPCLFVNRRALRKKIENY
ncbi:MAG: hypothetical protein ACLS61_07310 [Ruminococcus sp.]